MLTLSVCLVLSASIFAAADLQYQGGEGLYHNYNGEYAHSYDNYEPKGYQFEYAVSDPHTGDHKSQWEVKDKAGVVRGGYSLLEPDGTTRVVEYIADKNGFRAVVKKLGTAIHPGHAASHANVELDDSSNLHPLSENALYSSYNGHINNYANNVINLDSVHLPQEVHSGLEAVVVPEAHSYGGEISGHTLSLSPEVITLAQPHEEVSHGYVAQVQPQVLSAGWSNILAPKAEAIYIQAPKEVYSIPQYATAKSEVYSLPQYVAPKSEGLYTSLPVVQAQYALPQVHQVSSVGAAHPYGESSSSSNYYGVTNNPDDDSEYSVDDGHQGWQGVKGLPYNLALNY